MVKMAAQETMPTLKVGILMSNNSAASRNNTAGIRVALASGFTFIEVLIALVVVSIALLALLRFCLFSIKLADKARITSQAIFLAEEKINQMLATGYPKKGTNSGTEDNNGVLFDWQIEVTDAQLPGLDKPYVRGLRKISVDVSWKPQPRKMAAGQSGNHLQMSTYVADITYHEP